MPTRISARKRYDLKNPVISVRVSKEEYDKLDAFRAVEGKEWRELLLSLLDIKKATTVHQIGYCPDCHKPYSVDLTNASVKKCLDDSISHAIGPCKKCRGEPIPLKKERQYQ